MNDPLATICDEQLWRDGALRDDVVVLDVRTPAEFQEAHIPGSVNVPLGDLRKRKDEVVQHASGRPIAIVCRTGRRAATARDELRGHSVLGLQVLEGGLEAWLASALPVRRGKPALSLDRQVRIAAGALVVLGVGLGVLLHPGFLAIAGFVGAGLVFAGVTDTCGMAMLLARMPWNRRADPTCSVR